MGAGTSKSSATYPVKCSISEVAARISPCSEKTIDRTLGMSIIVTWPHKTPTTETSSVTVPRKGIVVAVTNGSGRMTAKEIDRQRVIK